MRCGGKSFGWYFIGHGAPQPTVVFQFPSRLGDFRPWPLLKAGIGNLTLLEVPEEDVALLGLLSPVLDDAARAVDDLADVTLLVEDTYIRENTLSA